MFMLQTIYTTSSDTFNILKSAAIATYGDLGAWTYDCYAEINEIYFDGAVN